MSTQLRVVLVVSPLPQGCGPGAGTLSLGLQSGRDGLVRGEHTDDRARFEVEIRAVSTPDGLDFLGPLVHGKRGDRFMYLSWGHADGPNQHRGFRRLKVYLSPVTRSGWSAPGLTEELAATGAARIDVNGALPDGTPNCGTARASWGPL